MIVPTRATGRTTALNSTSLDRVMTRENSCIRLVSRLHTRLVTVDSSELWLIGRALGLLSVSDLSYGRER